MTQRVFPASKAAMQHSGTIHGDSPWRMGGAIPGAPGEAAFAHTSLTPAPLPILIAVPHAGRAYPAELTKRMRSPAEVQLRLEDRKVDLLAEAVARETGASLIVAHAPRALIDLNRSPEDVDWDMITGGAAAGTNGPGVLHTAARHGAGRRARSGLGLVPRRLQGVGELWRRKLGVAELSARIELVHRPYHRTLGELMEGLRDRWGRALLIDLHSMPPLGPQTGPDAAASFVIGDRFGASCDGALLQSALNHFAVSGHRAAHNRPYAGGYVLDFHGAPARGLHALQLEVCRSAYLDARLCEPGAGFAQTAAAVAGLVRRLASELAAPRELAQAAE